MRKLLSATTLALLALLLLIVPAVAGKMWCQRDPIVRLNGRDVQILIAVPQDYAALVNGAVQVQVETPAGVSRELIYTDQGFNGYGEEVRFKRSNTGHIYADGSFDVRIRVGLPIDHKALNDLGYKGKAAKRMPLRLTIIINGQTVVSNTGSMTILGGDATNIQLLNDGTWVDFVMPAA